MSQEIQALAPTGRTVYALIRNASGAVWNGTAFATYLTANYSTYPVALTEQGSASGYYTGTFPSAIAAGTYSVVVKVQSGASPAESDANADAGELEWNGSAPVALSDLATSGQVGQFAPIRLSRGVAVSGFIFYLKSSLDHVSPLVSGVCSGQINRDGAGWTALQSGLAASAYTELGNGYFKCNLTSGDTNCDQAALLFTATTISGAAAADPCALVVYFQKTSGH